MVQELVLARQAEVPADAAVVIVAGPRQELLENEMQSLEAFLGRGGRLLLLLDPDTARGFMPFVQHYGLELSEDVIIETNPLGRLVGGDYLVPVVMSYEPHAITKDFGNTMSIFPVVRSVQVSKDLPEGITAQALASTSPESWAETDMQGLKEGRSAFDEGTDRRGPVSLAAVANIAPKHADEPARPQTAMRRKSRENPVGGRLVVFGDSEFANNNFFASPGNGNLFLNTVSWLAEEEDLIAIRPRQGGKSGPVMVDGPAGARGFSGCLWCYCPWRSLPRERWSFLDGDGGNEWQKNAGLDRHLTGPWRFLLLLRSGKAKKSARRPQNSVNSCCTLARMR